MASQIDTLKKIAAKNPKKIILPEGGEPRVLEAAAAITSERIADVILIGNEDEIAKKAKDNSISLKAIKIIGSENYPEREKLIDTFWEKKGDQG